jgi:hypothetical protein
MTYAAQCHLEIWAGGPDSEFALTCVKFRGARMEGWVLGLMEL